MWLWDELNIELKCQSVRRDMTFLVSNRPSYHTRYLQQIHWSKLLCGMYGFTAKSPVQHSTTMSLINKILGVSMEIINLFYKKKEYYQNGSKIDVVAGWPAGLPWPLFSLENSDWHPQDLYLLWNPVWRSKSLLLLPVKKWLMWFNRLQGSRMRWLLWIEGSIHFIAAPFFCTPDQNCRISENDFHGKHKISASNLQILFKSGSGNHHSPVTDHQTLPLTLT